MRVLVCFLFLLLFPTVSMESSCIEDWMVRELGVVEKTGKNDGVRINYYQKTTGNKTGDSYCSSFVATGFRDCGIKTTINGWSPSSHNPKNVVYFKHRFRKEPKTGDVVTFYSTSKGRINHTGFYYKYYNSRIYESIEANTSPNVVSGSLSDVNGQGVYKKKRSYNMTHSITRWSN